MAELFHDMHPYTGFRIEPLFAKNVNNPFITLLRREGLFRSRMQMNTFLRKNTMKAAMMQNKATAESESP